MGSESISSWFINTFFINPHPSSTAVTILSAKEQATIASRVMSGQNIQSFSPTCSLTAASVCWRPYLGSRPSPQTHQLKQPLVSLGFSSLFVCYFLESLFPSYSCSFSGVDFRAEPTILSHHFGTKQKLCCDTQNSSPLLS